MDIRLSAATYRQLNRESLSFFAGSMFAQLRPEIRFHENWHIRTVCWHLEQVAAGNIRRLIINVPPRHLKSFITSIAFPAWIFGRDPTKRIIAVSYSHALGESLTSDFRKVIGSPEYRQAFPRSQLSVKKNTESEQRFEAGGLRYSTSVGGTLTGRGADYIIIDDPIKAGEVMSDAERESVNRWYRQSVPTRLDDKASGAIIIVMQRLHENDLVGQLTEEDDHGWKVLSIPAIAEEDVTYRVSNRRNGRHHLRRSGDVIDPKRESLDTLEAIRREIGSVQFAAHYQQQPMPESGHYIRREWFQSYDRLPEGNHPIIQSWDTAMDVNEHNDFSVCTTWLVQDSHYFLRDVFRQKVSYPELRSAAFDLATRHRPGLIIIEKSGHGIALRDEMRRHFWCKQYSPQFYDPTPRTDKQTRLAGVSAIVEQGRILLPRSAPWLDAFVRELTGFPAGKHDDQVDSFTQFLEWMRSGNSILRFNPATGRPILARQSRRNLSRPVAA